MSKAQTLGFKWQLFVLDLSFIGWNILVSLTLGILDIWVAPYRAQANIAFFQEIKKIKGVGFFPPRPEDDDQFRPHDPFGEDNWEYAENKPRGIAPGLVVFTLRREPLPLPAASQSGRCRRRASPDRSGPAGSGGSRDRRRRTHSRCRYARP